ncbi:MAG: hypothetical protein ACI9MJ_002118, partial [Alphaproteobacteria bacterium]
RADRLPVENWNYACWNYACRNYACMTFWMTIRNSDCVNDR